MQYHNTLDALTFYQTGAECHGIYLQTFFLARLALEAGIKRAAANGVPPEYFYLTCDIDETVLNNSAFNVWSAQTGRDFSQKTWSAWCRAEKAEPTPGAKEFLDYADGMGVRIFYVTGRINDDREATANNLKKAKFPLSDWSADPEKTRLFMEKMDLEDQKGTGKFEQYAYLRDRLGEPLVRLGDNLSDHDPKRYGRSNRYDLRWENLKAEKSRLGVDWIIFPNPIYGNWRAALRQKIDDPTKGAPIADEIIVMPEQEAPVRPTVTPAEAPKMTVLNCWQP